jgi:hypothetical protein
MSAFTRIFGGAYARHLAHAREADAPTAIAAVTNVQATGQLHCSCGAVCRQSAWLNRRGDGSALLVCKQCKSELAAIHADLMTMK